jgi:lysophospholipase L1-like esterase
MKKAAYFALFALALLPGCGGSGCCVTTLYVFGDSITWGADLQAGEEFTCQRHETPNPKRMQELGNLTTFNEGRNGARVIDVLNGTDGEACSGVSHLPFAEQVKKIDGDVLFAYGAAAAVRDEQNFKENYRTLIRIAKAEKKKVFLRELTYFFEVGGITSEMIARNDAFNEDIRALGIEENVVVIPVRQIPATEQDVPDGVHISQAYSDKVAKMCHDFIVR